MYNHVGNMPEQNQGMSNQEQAKKESKMPQSENKEGRNISSLWHWILFSHYPTLKQKDHNPVNSVVTCIISNKLTPSQFTTHKGTNSGVKTG